MKILASEPILNVAVRKQAIKVTALFMIKSKGINKIRFHKYSSIGTGFKMRYKVTNEDKSRSMLLEIHKLSF